MALIAQRIKARRPWPEPPRKLKVAVLVSGCKRPILESLSL